MAIMLDPTKYQAYMAQCRTDERLEYAMRRVLREAREAGDFPETYIRRVVELVREHPDAYPDASTEGTHP